MKIAFITPSVSRSSGGIFEVEIALSKALYDLGYDIEVYGQNDENTLKDVVKWSPIKVYTFPSIGPVAFRYSPSLKKAGVFKWISIPFRVLKLVFDSTCVKTNKRLQNKKIITAVFFKCM